MALVNKKLNVNLARHLLNDSLYSVIFVKQLANVHFERMRF